MTKSALMPKLTIVHLLLMSVFSLIISSLNPAIADSKLSVTQHWFEDKTKILNPDQALEHFTAGKGKAIQNKVFKLGNEATHIWVLLKLINQTTEAQSLRLLAGVPYSKLLEARQIDLAKSTQHPVFTPLIEENKYRPFSQRNNHFRLLNSNRFSLGANATKLLLINTIVEGPSYLPFSILTDKEFSDLKLNDSVFAALFYGFTATLGLLFLLFSLAVKHRIAILYAALFLLGLLVIADIDGFAFQWLWPKQPLWNYYSPIVILPLLNCLGFIIVHQLLESIQSDRLRWLKPIAVALAIISLVLPLSLLVLPLSTVIQIENILSIPAFILQPIAFVSWLHLGRRSYFSQGAILIISLLVVTLVSSVFLDIALPELALKHLHHFAYLIVGLMVMGIITVQLIGLHKDQQSSLKRELVLAQENAQMNQSLLTAEKNYSRAQRLAKQHQQQLATASHDLRQPIVSLRASFDAIASKQSLSIQQQMKDAFDYLESLCNQHLQQSRPKETYPASLILGTVQRMFANEASARRIDLRKVDCSVALSFDPMILMRIISNLVANAIKHHSCPAKAKVLLGCRRKENHLIFTVCDNGPGINPEDLQTLQQAYKKGAQSEGEGLGLAIIYQLASENGIRIDCQSEVGKGTCFKVRVLE